MCYEQYTECGYDENIETGDGCLSDVAAVPVKRPPGLSHDTRTERDLQLKLRRQEKYSKLEELLTLTACFACRAFPALNLTVIVQFSVDAGTYGCPDARGKGRCTFGLQVGVPSEERAGA